MRFNRSTDELWHYIVNASIVTQPGWAAATWWIKWTWPPHRWSVCLHCIAASMPLVVNSKLFSFNVVIHFTSAMSCHPLRLLTVLLYDYSLTSELESGAPHFTASEISADRITAPISPLRNSPPAKFTDFALHRRQITPSCKSPPWRILRR